MNLFLLTFFTLLLTGALCNDCGLLNTLRAYQHSEFDENADTLQAQWIGKDTILLVASTSTTTSSTTNNPTQVWLGSMEDSTGRYRFTKHNSIPEPVNTQSLQVSKTSLTSVVIVGSTRQSLYVSINGGLAWSKYSFPDANFDPETDLTLSSVNPSHMMLTCTDGKLHVTTDYGQNWILISGRVNRAHLVNTSSNDEFIFYSTIYSSTRSPIHRYNLKTKVTDHIDNTAYRFYVDDRYLFVSRQNLTGNQPNDNLSRRFYVSTNYGSSHVTFSEVQLPAAKWEDYVEVLGTHEMGAFFHISKANDNLKGQLFVSDKSGIVFTLSLDNHLYHRYNGWRTSLYVNDFYEVKSMRGVYITSIELSNGAHYSMITFNNGGSWQKLIPPTGSCTSCSLHLHLSYSKTVNYNLNTLPLSTSNAVGMIIAHGTVGLSRNYASDNVNIVTSKDGGYTWTMHSQLNGTFSYGIGNYGNIMAVVRSGTIESSGTLWFSHDRGLCFQNEEIDTTSAFKLSKGFIMDPKGLGMYAFAIGLEGTEINDNWKLIAIDFNSVLDSTCHSNDYMTVTEHNVSNTCILGYKRQYRITKPTSICKNDASYSPLPVKTIRCNCSYSDMECDFGFKRSQGSNGKFTCAPDKSFNLSALCPPNQEYYDRNIAGFRLIAGDMCISTPETDALLKVVRTKCTGHENNSGTSNYVFNSHKVLAVIVGVLFILAAVIILAALVIYIIIYCRRRDTLINDRVVYKRIPLNDEESSCQSSDSDEDLLN